MAYYAVSVDDAETNRKFAESLEAIQLAEEYYRKALALRPQDPATRASQDQVRALVEERAASRLGELGAARAAAGAHGDAGDDQRRHAAIEVMLG